MSKEIEYVEREQREQLGKRLNSREPFYGRFERVGSKKGKQSGFTVLLLDIRGKGGQIVTDHLWINLTQGFRKLGHVEKGELIQFDARVVEYEKGYVGKNPKKVNKERLGLSTDYKLTYPTNFKRFLAKEGQRISTSERMYQELKRKKRNSKKKNRPKKKK